VGIAAFAATIAMFVVETSAQATASARLFYGRSPAVQGCADEAALRGAIAQRAGHDPISPNAPNSVAVSITRDGDQLVADVKLANREGLFVGSRTLKGPASQCGELTDTIALTVAIALDTNDKLTPSDPSDPATPPVPAAASATPAAAASATPPGVAATSSPEPADSPPDREAPTGVRDQPHTASPAAASTAPSAHWEIGAGVGGTLYGIAPAASLGATMGAALRWARFSVGIEGWADLPSSAAAPAIADARVRTSLLGAGPVACLHFGNYFGCALGIVGALRAEAFGVPGASNGSTIDVLLGIRGGVALRIASWLFLPVSVDLLADPVPPTVRASGRSLWRASPIAAVSQLGLAMRIP
jgi:hypothetical protein